MRFSDLQDNGYGVGLPRDRLPGDADKTAMADIDNVGSKNDTVDEGPLVSNLPLLFANGYPTSLEKITLAQLECFVTFMVQCSLGHNTTDEISKPQWWPKEVMFSNPLTRPRKVNENWMANLKKLVFRCYTYHRSEYLLRFCSYLARYPHEELEYVNNWDSTTSLYHKSTGKLLVTFRNENLNYDRRNENGRKKLLTCNGVASGYSVKSKQHALIMVEPPTEDIYLCDNCDAEFLDLKKMKEHERTCCEGEHRGRNSRPTTPEIPVTAEPELVQDQFLEYFRLHSTKVDLEDTKRNDASTGHNNVGSNANNNAKSKVNGNVIRCASRRVRGSINFTRCQTIPFSSPAGILLAKKSKAMTEETQQERLERIERHLVAPALNDSSRPKWLDGEAERVKWIVTHKSSREKLTNQYVHQYRFVNSVQRKPVLSIQAQLLCIVCRPVCVLLTRLNQERLSKLKRDPSDRCPFEEISTNRMGRTTEGRGNVRRSVALKRKASGDESDSAVVSEKKKEIVLTDSETSTGALTVCQVVRSSEVNSTVCRSTDTAVARSADAITLIDLCSSDEEENLNPPASSDENRDTMNFTDTNVTKFTLDKLVAPKQCPKARICSTDSTDERLSVHGANNDGENCTNKLRNSIVSSTRTHLSPVLRPAP